MTMKRFLALSTACFALAACTTIRDVSDSHEGGRYRVGETATARIGEVMFDQARYTSAPEAFTRASIPPAPGRRGVAISTRLVARDVDGERAYCTPIESSFACFYDLDRNGDLDHVLVSNLGIVSSKQPLEPAVKYDLGPGSTMRGFKSELIYQGRAGDVLTLSYRDYANSLSLPSYEQTLSYTLDPKAPTEIRYRDARFKVLQADNQSIRYQILSGFSDAQSP